MKVSHLTGEGKGEGKKKGEGVTPEASSGPRWCIRDQQPNGKSHKIFFRIIGKRDKGLGGSMGQGAGRSSGAKSLGA